MLQQRGGHALINGLTREEQFYLVIFRWRSDINRCRLHSHA